MKLICYQKRMLYKNTHIGWNTHVRIKYKFFYALYIIIFWNTIAVIAMCWYVAHTVGYSYYKRIFIRKYTVLKKATSLAEFYSLMTLRRRSRTMYIPLHSMNTCTRIHLNATWNLLLFVVTFAIFAHINNISVIYIYITNNLNVSCRPTLCIYCLSSYNKHCCILIWLLWISLFLSKSSEIEGYVSNHRPIQLLNEDSSMQTSLT